MKISSADQTIIKILNQDYALAIKVKDVLPAPVYEIGIDMSEGELKGKE